MGGFVSIYIYIIVMKTINTNISASIIYYDLRLLLLFMKRHEFWG